MNKNVFASTGGNSPVADVKNEAGGMGYSFTAEEQVAQYAATGTFNNTYYATATDQLTNLKEKLAKCSSLFIAKTAVYARKEGKMKDMPAFLLAYLCGRYKTLPSDTLASLIKKAAVHVLNNGKMVRNFVQVLRSGSVGRKSLGSLPKQLVRNWFDNLSDERLFQESIGNSPSVTDMIRMVHPKPKDDKRNAMFKYLLGKEVDKALLPQKVQEFEAWKADRTKPMPVIDFRFVAPLGITDLQWQELAAVASWETVRMNLNNYEKHGVLNNLPLVDKLAKKLEETPDSCMPYTLFTTFKNMNSNIPKRLREAVENAAEKALANTPALEGNVWVAVDISGSMGSPATGYRVGSTSVVTYVDVAAFMAAAIKRRNPNARLVLFNDKAQEHTDLIRTNRKVLQVADDISKQLGGGTDCGAAISYIHRQKLPVDTVVMISDNMSWMDWLNVGHGYNGRDNGTSVTYWNSIKKDWPNAKLINIDIAPYTSSQFPQSWKDVYHIGGFSDAVFDFIDVVTSKNKTSWIEVINGVEL